MAREQTPRLGLDTFTSGSDLHPNREEFNDRMRRIDDQAAVFDQVPGQTLPDPGIPGRVLVFRGGNPGNMRDVIYYDDGESWSPFVQFGSSDLLRNIVTSSSATVGTSTRAARADHSHQLPLATATTHGALPSGDKAALNGRTSNPVSSTMMIRDGNGRTQAQDPSTAQHVATKRYVDSGMPLATPASQGAMSAPDKAKLNTATSNNTPGSIVQRSTPSGHFAIPTPNANTHPTTKGYVDDLVNQGMVFRGTAPQHLNNAQEIGVYDVQPGMTTGGNPATSFATLFVPASSAAAGHSWQILFQHNGGQMWTRSRHTTLGWLSWNRIMTESDMSSAIESNWTVSRGANTRNLNTVTQPGSYGLGLDSTNTPESGATANLEVHPLSTQRVMQKVTYPTRGYRQYFRQQDLDTGAWTDWARVV